MHIVYVFCTNGIKSRKASRDHLAIALLWLIFVTITSLDNSSIAFPVVFSVSCRFQRFLSFLVYCLLFLCQTYPIFQHLHGFNNYEELLQMQRMPVVREINLSLLLKFNLISLLLIFFVNLFLFAKFTLKYFLKRGESRLKQNSSSFPVIET